MSEVATAPGLAREQATGGFVLRAIPELAAQVAHDLNNHLATMLGKSELALMLDDPGRYRPALGDILSAGQPARTLVADVQRVLSWSKGRTEPVAFGEILALVRRLNARRCERVGVELACRPIEGGGRAIQPAAVSLIVWRLLRGALDRIAGSETEWVLSSRSLPHGTAIVLETPGHVWQGSASEAQVAAPDPIGAVLDGVEETGASVRPLGESVEIVFPREG